MAISLPVSSSESGPGWVIDTIERVLVGGVALILIAN